MPAKRLFSVFLTACFLVGCGSMAKEALSVEKPTEFPAQAEQEIATPTTEPIEKQEVDTMQIQIGEKKFSIILENNAAVEALLEQLPLELDMSELNDNEKYNYLPFSLPTSSARPEQIHAGDIMLFGDNCLVVFYESFSSSYSYTMLGRMEDVTGLQEAVGASNVQMAFLP